MYESGRPTYHVLSFCPIKCIGIDAAIIDIVQDIKPVLGLCFTANYNLNIFRNMSDARLTAKCSFQSTIHIQFKVGF